MHQNNKISNEIKIVFFGGRHVYDIVLQLNNNFALLLLVTTDSGMARYATSEKIPFTRVISLDKKFVGEIKKLKPDLGVIADFGLIIPQVLMDVFPLGIINIHPSLLPKYRGPTPVQRAILAGNKRTGITIIKIDDQIDHGPILYQEEYESKPNDFTDKLLIELFRKSGQILPNLIKKYAAKDVDLVEQDDKKATYTKVFTKEDGYIDPNNPVEKRKLRRMINALNPWPGVWTKFELSNKEVVIKLLPNNQIQVEGKKPMSYKDFKNGYPNGEEFLRKLNII